MFEMLSRITPLPVNAVASNLMPRPIRGASLFVFNYNVEKCWTVQGGNCTPPRENTKRRKDNLDFFVF